MYEEVEKPLSTGVITVVKADGPGWLIIAETYEDGRYRMVRELFGDEPVTDEVLKFIDWLPRRLAGIEGAEVDLKNPLGEQRRVSPKRAARHAAREVAEARDPGRFQPTKSMRLAQAEFDLAHAVQQNLRELEVTVWVRYGKKHSTVLEETHDGYRVVEIAGQASDPDANRKVSLVLAPYYATNPERIELLHGYANPKKTFRLMIPV